MDLAEQLLDERLARLAAEALDNLDELGPSDGYDRG